MSINELSSPKIGISNRASSNLQPVLLENINLELLCFVIFSSLFIAQARKTSEIDGNMHLSVSGYLIMIIQYSFLYDAVRS